MKQPAPGRHSDIPVRVEPPATGQLDVPSAFQRKEKNVALSRPTRARWRTDERARRRPLSHPPRLWLLLGVVVVVVGRSRARPDGSCWLLLRRARREVCVPVSPPRARRWGWLLGWVAVAPAARSRPGPSRTRTARLAVGGSLPRSLRRNSPRQPAGT